MGGGGAGGGLKGSRVRRVSCHNTKDSERSISAAALPPAAEEALPSLRGKRSRFGRSPTQLSKQDVVRDTERERGEVSRLEGEGRTVAVSVLHSSLERNRRVSEPKVAVSGQREGDKNDLDHSEVKPGHTETAFSTDLQSQGQQRREDIESNGSYYGL